MPVSAVRILVRWSSVERNTGGPVNIWILQNNAVHTTFSTVSNH